MPLRWRRPAAGVEPSALKDPLGDRVVAHVKPPIVEVLTEERCCSNGQTPDVTILRKHLEREGALEQEFLLSLISKASAILHDEPNLIKLDDPINIVGNIHGQVFDLFNAFDQGRAKGVEVFLFLGNYVNRGLWGIEVVAYLFACKIQNRDGIYLLRGNHDSRMMTANLNFRRECEYKYDLSVYNAVMDAFDQLPLAAVINGKDFCVNGGLSPSLHSLDDIAHINRTTEVPSEGLFCDLLWSDPSHFPVSKTIKVSCDYLLNKKRKCSVIYTAWCVRKFLLNNKLRCIVRSSEVQLEGYKLHFEDPNTGFPGVITVFSAPNFCGTFENKAGLLCLVNATMNIVQYKDAPQPYQLPDYMDCFGWSYPFIMEKTLDFMTTLHGIGRTSELVYDLKCKCGKEYGKLSLFCDKCGKPRGKHQEAFPEPLPLPPLVKDLVTKFIKMTSEKEDFGDNPFILQSGLPKKFKQMVRAVQACKAVRQEHQEMLRSKRVTCGSPLARVDTLKGTKDISDEDRFRQMQRADASNVANPSAPDEDEGTIFKKKVERPKKPKK